MPFRLNPKNLRDLNLNFLLNKNTRRAGIHHVVHVHRSFPCGFHFGHHPPAMRAGEATGGVDRDDPGHSEDGMLVRRRSAGPGAARDTAQEAKTERMACWWWPQTPRQIPRGPPPRARERPDNTVMRAAHGPGPRSHADCGEYVEQPRLEHSLRNRRWRTNQN